MFMCADAGAIRHANHDRKARVSPGAEPYPSEVACDLVERRIGETFELDLRDRTGTGNGHSDRRPNDPALVDRCIHYSTGAELIEKTLRDSEHTPGYGNVLSEEYRGRISAHFLVQCRVDRIGHRHRRPRAWW